MTIETVISRIENLGRSSDITETLVRVTAGAFLMPHGAQKLFGWFGGYGLEATGQFFQAQLGFSNGYLAAFSAGSVEFFAGLALALGLFTRAAALAVTIFLLIASTVHFGGGFFWTDGGWEYPILWAVLALSFVSKGGGRYSLDSAFGIRF